MSRVNHQSKRCALLATTLLALLAWGAALAGPAEFTYQAQLVDSAQTPIVSNSVDITLAIYDAPSGGNLRATHSFLNQDLSGSNGYVSLTVPSTGLDLNQDLYIEVTVDDDNDPLGPETLAPRQKVRSVPYAINATRGFETYTRAVFVKPTGTASAAPAGTLEDPFTDINAAYAKAKTLGPSYQNRVVVVLMPGSHTVNTTVVMDTQAIDLIGWGEKSAVVIGTADPLINATATGGTGATIRNLILQPNGATNQALHIRDGRVNDVIINRSPAAGAHGNLMTINTSATGGFSMKSFEMYGNILVTNYAPQTSLSDGFILGAVSSTGASAAATDYLALMNLSNVGGVSFTPPAPFGILLMSNVSMVGAAVYTPNTVIQASGVGFGTPGAALALPDPMVGSVLANCLANSAAWTAPVATSTGNVAGEYVAYLRK